MTHLEDVKLRETKYPWRRGGKKWGSCDSKVEDIHKKVQSILNKLTSDNLQSLIRKLKDLLVTNSKSLQEVVNVIFAKAIKEPTFTPVYAQMCKALSRIQVCARFTGNNEPQFNEFHTLLIKCCLEEFQTIIQFHTDQEIELVEILNTKTAEKKEKLKLMGQYKEKKLLMKSVGTMKFIGELFRLQIIPTLIIHQFLKQLLSEGSEITLECLCILLTTVGKDMEIRKLDLKTYFHTIKIIVNLQGALSNRIRFMLQGVIELYDQKWIQRRKCLDQELEEENILPAPKNSRKPHVADSTSNCQRSPGLSSKMEGVGEHCNTEFYTEDTVPVKKRLKISEYYNGVFHSLINDASGIISFHVDGEEQKAIFFKENVFINGVKLESCISFEKVLTVGKPARIMVEPQIGDHRFKATFVEVFEDCITNELLRTKIMSLSQNTLVETVVAQSSDLIEAMNPLRLEEKTQFPINSCATEKIPGLLDVQPNKEIEKRGIIAPTPFSMGNSLVLQHTSEVENNVLIDQTCNKESNCNALKSDECGSFQRSSDVRVMYNELYSGTLRSVDDISGTISFQVENQWEEAVFFKESVRINNSKLKTGVALTTLLRTGKPVRLMVEPHNKHHKYKALLVEVLQKDIQETFPMMEKISVNQNDMKEHAALQNYSINEGGPLNLPKKDLSLNNFDSIEYCLSLTNLQEVDSDHDETSESSFEGNRKNAEECVVHKKCEYFGNVSKNWDFEKSLVGDSENMFSLQNCDSIENFCTDQDNEQTFEADNKNTVLSQESAIQENDSVQTCFNVKHNSCVYGILQSLISRVSGIISFHVENEPQNAIFFNKSVLINNTRLKRSESLENVLKVGMLLRLIVKPHIGRFDCNFKATRVEVFKEDIINKLEENACGLEKENENPNEMPLYSRYSGTIERFIDVVSGIISFHAFNEIHTAVFFFQESVGFNKTHLKPNVPLETVLNVGMSVTVTLETHTGDFNCKYKATIVEVLQDPGAEFNVCTSNVSPQSEVLQNATAESKVCTSNASPQCEGLQDAGAESKVCTSNVSPQSEVLQNATAKSKVCTSNASPQCEGLQDAGAESKVCTSNVSPQSEVLQNATAKSKVCTSNASPQCEGLQDAGAESKVCTSNVSPQSEVLQNATAKSKVCRSNASHLSELLQDAGAVSKVYTSNALPQSEEYCGKIVYMSSNVGIVVFRKENKSEKAKLFRNKLFINDIMVSKTVSLMDIFKIGDQIHFFEVQNVKMKGTELKFELTHVYTEKQRKEDVTVFNTEHQGEFISDVKSFSKLPNMTHVAFYPGTVINILSPRKGVIGFKYYGDQMAIFKLSDIFVDGKRCNCNTTLHYYNIKKDDTFHFNANLLKERNDYSGAAFIVTSMWTKVKPPSLAQVFESYLPIASKASKLPANTLVYGTVVEISPPKAAMVTVKSGDFSVPVLVLITSMRSEEGGKKMNDRDFIQDHLCIGDRVSLKIQKHGTISKFTMAVEAWKVVCEIKNNSQLESKEMVLEMQVPIVSEVQSRSKQSSVILPKVTAGTSTDLSKSVDVPFSPKGKGSYSLKTSSTSSTSEVKGCTGRVKRFLSSTCGILEYIFHGRHFEGTFTSDIVVYPDNRKCENVSDLWPVGSQIYFDAVIKDLQDFPSMNITSVWKSKKRDKKAVFNKMPFTVNFHGEDVLKKGVEYCGVVSEIRPPYAFVATIAQAGSNVSVFVFGPNFRPVHSLQKLPQHHPVTPFITIGETVHMLVDKHQGYVEFKWYAVDAWKADDISSDIKQSVCEKESVSSSEKNDNISATLQGTLVQVEHSWGLLESNSLKEQVLFHGQDTLLLGVPLEDLDLNQLLKPGDKLTFLLSHESSNIDGVIPKASQVWFGSCHDLDNFTHHHRDIICYCKSRSIDRTTTNILTQRLGKRVPSQEDIGKEKQAVSIEDDCEEKSATSERSLLKTNPESCVNSSDIAELGTEITSNGTIDNEQIFIVKNVVSCEGVDCVEEGTQLSKIRDSVYFEEGDTNSNLVRNHETTTQIPDNECSSASHSASERNQCDIKSEPRNNIIESEETKNQEIVESADSILNESMSEILQSSLLTVLNRHGIGETFSRLLVARTVSFFESEVKEIVNTGCMEGELKSCITDTARSNSRSDLTNVPYCSLSVTDNIDYNTMKSHEELSIVGSAQTYCNMKELSEGRTCAERLSTPIEEAAMSSRTEKKQDAIVVPGLVQACLDSQNSDFQIQLEDKAEKKVELVNQGTQTVSTGKAFFIQILPNV